MGEKKKFAGVMTVIVVAFLTAGCAVEVSPTTAEIGLRKPNLLFPIEGTQVTIINGMPGGEPYYLKIIGKEMKPLGPGEAMVIRLRPSIFQERRERRELAVQFSDINGNHIETKTRRFRVGTELEETTWIATIRSRRRR